MGPVPPEHEVIFRNGDKLDCRKENLRVVNKQEARQVTAHAILRAGSDNASKAKKKRAPKTPEPASFAFGIMQHVVEATGNKPDEPRRPREGPEQAWMPQEGAKGYREAGQ
jgi:hypothetical protein